MCVEDTGVSMDQCYDLPVPPKSKKQHITGLSSALTQQPTFFQRASGHGFLTFLGPTACEAITDVLPSERFWWSSTTQKVI